MRKQRKKPEFVNRTFSHTKLSDDDIKKISIKDFVINVENQPFYPFRNNNYLKILLGFVNKPKGHTFYETTLRRVSKATRYSIREFVKENSSMLIFPNNPSKKFFILKDFWYDLYFSLLKINKNVEKQHNT